MGAWIETYALGVIMCGLGAVAPLMGAWIETPEAASLYASDLGRTSHGCVD